MDDTRFFEHGSVSVVSVDPELRRAMYSITLPFCILHEIYDILLFHGKITDIKVNDPVAIWQPRLDESIKAKLPGVDAASLDKTYALLKNHIESYVIYLLDICHILGDKSILTPAFPMGMYISVNYATGIDSIPSILEALQGRIQTLGIAEIQLAFSAILSETLRIIP